MKSIKSLILNGGVLSGLVAHVYFNNELTRNVYNFIVILSWFSFLLLLVIIPVLYTVLKDFSTDVKRVKAVREFVSYSNTTSIMSVIQLGFLLYLGNVWLVTSSIIIAIFVKGYKDDLKLKLKELDKNN